MQATSTRGGVPLGQPSAMSGNSFTSFLSGKTSRPHPEVRCPHPHTLFVGGKG